MKFVPSRAVDAVNNEIRLPILAKRDFIAKRFHPPQVDFIRHRRISLKNPLLSRGVFLWGE